MAAAVGDAASPVRHTLAAHAAAEQGQEAGLRSTDQHHCPSHAPPAHTCPPLAEDRICGTIDIEKALTEGIKAYEPGLLARANRGIL